MADIFFKGSEGTQQVSPSPDESVLDALLRVGVDVPYGCKSGVCQSCIMQCADGTLPSLSQNGLLATQKEQGFFLSCRCQPEEDLTVQTVHDKEIKNALVLDKKVIAQSVLRLRLQAELDFRSGQFLTAWRDSGTARSYSIASHPDQDDFIELHIRIYPDGAFSQWAVNQLSIGDTLRIQGPMGQCFYTSADADKELLLVGLGTGVAPLYAIARDALLRGHDKPVHIFAGGGNEKMATYLQPEFDELASQFPQLQVCFSSPMMSENSDIYKLVADKKPNCQNVSATVCGAVSFVQKMKKQIFLSGAKMTNIRSDPFLAFST